MTSDQFRMIDTWAGTPGATAHQARIAWDDAKTRLEIDDPQIIAPFARLLLDEAVMAANHKAARIWNENHPVGTAMETTYIGNPHHRVVTTSEAFISSYGGVSVGVDLDPGSRSIADLRDIEG